ncbi:MAG: nitrogen fixation protein NifH [Chloroflexi bacterium]|nr:nitrogen fixation protein NifH [Chloroflexota bacterium]
MNPSSLANERLAWLLEPDAENPGPRYLALRELLERPADDPEVCQAQEAVMLAGPVAAILAAMHPDGYWVKAGSGYNPKYRSSVWQIIFLAELGADPADARVRRGCDYLIRHNQAASGAFSYTRPAASSGAIHCLNGNLLYALIRLGFLEDERVQKALAWQAQAITGEGEVRYYKSGTPAPGFACAVNYSQPCGWGANKAMKALTAVPPERRTPAVQRAIQAGVEFLFGRDPAAADYPYSERVSSTWFKFGFPLAYWSDVLETAAVLAAAGHGRDPRLENALRFIKGKQDAQGHWKLENALSGKMWSDIEAKGKPSKWITLRALRVLKACGR